MPGDGFPAGLQEPQAEVVDRAAGVHLGGADLERSMDEVGGCVDVAAERADGVCIGGKSVAQVHNWLYRPVAPAVGVPAGFDVPRSLDSYTICRVSLLMSPGLPVWAPETLLAYMAARPSKFSWDSIADWLPDMAAEIAAEAVAAELKGRKRSTWMKTAYLLHEAEAVEAAQRVAAAAPNGGRGPYLFGSRRDAAEPFSKPPRWHAEFQVVDYVLSQWWLPRW